jgi:hypothetical protein
MTVMKQTEASPLLAFNLRNYEVDFVKLQQQVANVNESHRIAA